MKKAIKLQRAAFLSEFKGQYDAYLNTRSEKTSLLRAFSFGDFNLRDYCANFYPHPKKNQLTYQAKSYCDTYGIWLDNAAQYITCAIYLFPSGDETRMKPLLQNCAVDFWLNDTWGRELFAGLNQQEKALARQVIRRISTDNGIMNPPADAHPIELATREMMLKFKRNSPSAWYRRFSRLYNYHVKITHKNLNADQLGKVLTVDEYIERRCHISGMLHTLTFLEYAEGQFLNWVQDADASLKKGDSYRNSPFLFLLTHMINNELQIRIYSLRRLDIRVFQRYKKSHSGILFPAFSFCSLNCNTTTNPNTFLAD